MSAGKLKRGSTYEGDIEKYFVKRVEDCGAMAEKFTSPGKKFVPDRLVTWPRYGFATIHFVELKTIGGKLEPGQTRDHERRRKLGAFVFVLWTKDQVDQYIDIHGPIPF
jgi:hypothetical protein